MLNQLQHQFQRLRDEVNSISQLAAQLQQAEQANSAQLQQLQQKEMFATQNLQRIQQLASQIHQNIIQASNIAQQLSGAAAFPQVQAAYQYTTSPTGYTPFQQQAGTGWSAVAPAYTQTAYPGQTGAAYQRGYTAQYGYGYNPAQTAEMTAQYSIPQTGFTAQYGYGQERGNQLLFGTQSGWGTQMQTGWSSPFQAGFTGQAGQMAQYGNPAFSSAQYYGQYTGQRAMQF